MDEVMARDTSRQDESYSPLVQAGADIRRQIVRMHRTHAWIGVVAGRAPGAAVHGTRLASVWQHCN